MQLLKTLKTNWRDILVGVAIVFIVAFVADVIERLAITNEGEVWLLNLTGALRGIATFAAANLAAWFMLAVSWPTLNHFSNDSFLEAWESLTARDQFQAFLVVACIEILAAAICFAS